jgi:predicted Rdx family selenoprotein
VAEEIIAQFGEGVDTITLIRGAGGRFEVTIDGKLIFSKAQVRRQAQPGEVSDLIRARQTASGRDPSRTAV